MIQKGFYFHFKRDKNGDLGNYAYEVIGVGLNTETRTESVIYRPLYKSEHLDSHDLYIRPLNMFEEFVMVNNNQVKRFELVTDPELINKLIEIRGKMYQ